MIESMYEAPDEFYEHFGHDPKTLTEEQKQIVIWNYLKDIDIFEHPYEHYAFLKKEYRYESGDMG